MRIVQPTSIRVQIALVLALSVGSLVAVSWTGVGASRLRHKEQKVREELLAASKGLNDAVVGDFIPTSENILERESANLKLREISTRVLREFPGVEGGFYVGGSRNGFIGYGFPTERGGGELGVTQSSLPATELSDAAPPPARHGDDPPPHETPYILVQAEHSFSLGPGEYQFDARSIGPSRVAILTRPVGASRPAAMVCWVMYRISSPEDVAAQLSHYEISTALSLAGIVLAIVLTANLIRRLNRQHASEQQLREELRRSEHLAALGTMLAGVAHEVRNPLAGIRSTVQLWERLPETSRTPASMAAVISAVDRLNDIVSRLLYFSRADTAERAPVQINELLDETLELQKAKADEQAVVIERELLKDLPSVLGAANALRQVILNLLTNALQAMPSGGILRCSTSHVSSRGIIEVRIEDTGSGVSASDEKHLFEPFFTTRVQGTGLGLALCREVITRHKGRIELLSSSPGKTVFLVELPAQIKVS